MADGLAEAIQAIIRTTGIHERDLIPVLEKAISLAYRRRFGEEAAGARIQVEIDRQSHRPVVYVCKEVVDTVENPHFQVQLAEARRQDGAAEPGDVLLEEINPEALGRIGAQVAKQFLMQRLRELHRDQVYEEYSKQLRGVVTAEVQRRDDKDNVYVNLGSAEGVVPRREQVDGERYRPGERMRFLVLDARHSLRAAQVTLSRTNPELVSRLLEMEVPEIVEGVVKIVAVARKPGVRSKVAVDSTNEQIDPVGACIGSGGARAMAVSSELRGEKIEIVRYSPDTRQFLANSLSPARVTEVSLDEENREASVLVPDDQLSLAIGKGGFNVRLAARLTGWRINLRSVGEAVGGQEGLVVSGDDERAAPEDVQPEPAESPAQAQSEGGEQHQEA